ncbi:unnamed protein product [Allacma fusca]|uniref:Basement membrane-specific heparan sulfate proteoglycan core protein n=1 Tax=Allacma fusca TaxID=39272 RepID=A0A8J2NPG0_9HEXA|nr:unnamed protein product [Allacma fusca]
MRVLFVLKIFVCVQFVSPYILQHPPEKPESDLIFDEDDVNSIRNQVKTNVEKYTDDSTQSKNAIRPRRATRNWGESEDEDSFSEEYETYDAKSDSGNQIDSFGPSKSKSASNNYISNSINHFHDHAAPTAKKSHVSDSDDEDLVGPGSGAGTDQDERTYVAAPTSSTNTNTKCNVNEFRCHVSGRCIDLQLRCDWIPDCGPDDNSDELNCSQNIICPSDQFACEGGSKCIPLSARCDGHYDCADFSDEDCGNGKGPFLELKPHPALQTVRQGNEVVFQCRDESLKRAHVRWARGNGLPLPPGSRDDNGRLEIPNVALDDTGTFVCEATDYPASTPGARASVYLRVESNQLRPPTACAAHEATCTNGECIDKSMVCDGDKDCSDGSDEIRCGKRDDCEPNELRCSNKRCIPKTWRCDGDNDCGDNTDELSCTPPPPGSPCRYDEFTCTTGNQCVSKMFHCDKENDCTDHSDEVGCSKPVIQRPPLPLVTLDAGDVFNISCSALGNPMPEIVWRLNWGHIPDKCTTSSVNGQGVLTCPKIELADQGAYSCESINSLGSTFAIPDCILVVKSTSTVCSPGTFNDLATTPEECTPCFCFGHSSTCDSSGLYLADLPNPGIGFGLVGVSQDLRTGKVKIQDGDSGTNLPSVVLRTVRPNVVQASSLNTKGTGIIATDVISYVNLSPSYAGNFLKSYSGNLRYTLKFSAQGDYLYAPDVIISGNNVTLMWFGGEMGPDQEHAIEVRYWPGKWYKRMHARSGSTTVEGIHAASREEIMQVLANVEYILIRAQYDKGSPVETTMSRIRMESASVSNSGRGQAIHIEKCRCPPGYSGLSCNECAPEYERKHSGPWIGICTRTASEYKELSCPEGYYFELGQCKVCPCPEYGKSFGKSCFKADDGEVTCNCVEGHAGRTCQQCSHGYLPNPNYPHDCRLSATQCDVSGSVPGAFDHKTGRCICKDQATGPLCNECKPNAFHLSKDNLHGCTSCFCMGITSQCSSSNWYRTQETANFVQNSYGFTLVDEAKRNVIRDGYSVDQYTRELGFKEFHRYLPEIYYWQLPYNFLGDKITSYGGNLNYTIRYIPAPGGHNSLNSAADVEISGNNVTLLYFSKIPVPANSREIMSVPLLEQYWQRQDGQLASRELLLMALANIDALLIKATYTTSTREAHLSDVILDYAVSHNTGQDLAHTVEQCACPQGYMGSSCQECAFGYTRILRGLYLGHCVPCFCNGYSNECNPKTGVCQNCRGNTTGDFCEQCDRGYMADPRTGGCILEIGPVPLRDANCTCDARGSHRPGCPDGRNCLCKGNVEGRTCSLCRPSTFALQENNPQGCLQCYCSRVSKECSSATLYRHSIDSEMIPEIQGFTLTNGNGKILKDIAVNQNSEESGMRPSSSSKSERWFWSLPSKFTGNRITSYGGKLRATRMYYIRPGGGSRKVVQGDLLRVTEDIDVMLVGNNGVSLFRALNDSLLPGQEVRLEVPLEETAGWRHLEGSSNPANREDIMEVLSDLKAILIRASFTDGMVAASINSVSLEDAVRQYTPNGVVMEVEECQCPVGYGGLSCESCSVGYYRNPKDNSRGVPGGSCQACPCSHNSESCRLEFGRPICICRAGFSGPKCEVRDGEPSNILLPQVSISGPTLQTVPVGGSVTLRCEGESHNGAGVKVIWSRENGVISTRARDNGLGALTLDEVLPSDSGTYLCNATDDYGFTVVTVVLTIIEEEFYNFPTPPKVSIRPLNLTVQRGYPARITCTAIGNPTPSISWTRGRTGILPPHVSIENGDLVIPSTRKSDQAEYFCTARNPAGIDTGSASLRIKEEEDVAPIIAPSTDFTVTATPSKYETRPGKIVHFRCTTSENDTRIEWTKLSEPLPLSATQSPDGSLNIFFVRDSDSGIYICTATSSSGKIAESQISLAVFQTSTPPDARIEPERQTVEQGKPFEIICIISGNPTPTIEWTKVGSDLPSTLSASDEVLRIPSAQVSDRGVYVCTVENSAGRASASTIVEVNPREEPQIDIYPSPRQTIIQNGSALFQCRVLAGIPPPVVSWSRANGQLMPANVEEIQSGVLQFNGVTGDEGGQYRCNAVSEAGSATAIATLVIQYPPKVFITPNTSLRVRKGESVRLQCRAEGDPFPSVTWKRLQNTEDDWIELPSSALSPPQMPTFEIQNIVKSDEGYYSCVASNDVGVDQEVLQLLVEELSEPLYSTIPQSSSHTKDEEIPRILEGSRTISNCIQSPPRIVVQPVRQFVRVGDVVRFECLASGDPPITTSWSRVDRKPLPFHAVLRGSQLMFRGIQVSDAGRYACLARNSGGTAESVAEVVVNSEDGPPIPRPQLTVSEKTGYAGSSIDLFCLSTNDIVTWTKEGAESLPRTAIPLGSRLKFIDLQMSDSGRYVCETDEGSEIVVLTVEAAPSAVRFSPSGTQIQVSIPEVVVETGSSVTFRCQGNFPQNGVQVRMLWSKENDVLPTERVHDIGSGLLAIEKVQPSDSGTYVCSVTDGYNLSTDRIMLAISEEKNDNCIKTKFEEADVEVLQSSMKLESLLSRESRNNVVNSLVRFYYRIEDLIEENGRSAQVFEKAAEEGSLFTESDSELLQSATSIQTIISEDGLKQILNLLTRIYYFIRSIVNEVLGNLETLRKQATEMETMFTEGDLKMIQSVRDSENIFSREGMTSLLNLVMRSYFFMGEIIEMELNKVGEIQGDEKNLEDILYEGYDLFGSVSSSEDVLSRYSLSKFINFFLRVPDVVLDEIRGTDSNVNLGVEGTENIQDHDDNATSLQSETEFERIFSRRVSALTVKIFNFLRRIFERHCQEIVDVSNMQSCKSTTITSENSTAETVTATTVESDRNGTKLESTDTKGMAVTTSKSQPTKEIESDISESREIPENIAKGVNKTTAVEEHETVQETQIEDSGEIHSQGAKSHGVKEIEHNVEHTEIIEEEIEETVNQPAKGSKVKGEGVVNETVEIAGGTFGGENITDYDEYYDEEIETGKVVKNRTKVTTGTITNVTIVQNQVDEEIEEYDYEEVGTNLGENLEGESKGISKGVRKVKKVKVKGNATGTVDSFGVGVKNNTLEETVYYDEETQGRKKGHGATKNITQQLDLDFPDAFEEEEEIEEVIYTNGTTRKKSKGQQAVNQTVEVSGGGFQGAGGNATDILYYDEESEGETHHGRRIVRKRTKHVNVTKIVVPNVPSVKNQVNKQVGGVFNFDGGSGNEDTEHSEVVEEESYDISGNGTTKRTRIIGHGGGHSSVTIVEKASKGGGVNGNTEHIENIEYYDEEVEESQNGQKAVKNIRKKGGAKNPQGSIVEGHEETISESGAKKNIKGQWAVNDTTVAGGNVVKGVVGGNDGLAQEYEYYDEEIEENVGGQRVPKNKRKNNSSTNSPDVIYEGSDEIIYENAARKKSKGRQSVNRTVIVDGEVERLGHKNDENIEETDYYDEEIQEISHGSHTVKKTSVKKGTSKGTVTKVSEGKSTVQIVGPGLVTNVPGNVDQVIEYYDEETEPVSTVVKTKIKELAHGSLGNGAKVKHQSAFHTTAGVTVGGGQILDDNDQYVEVSEEIQQDEAIAGGKSPGYVLGEFRSFGGDGTQSQNNGDPQDAGVVQENGPALLQTGAPFEGIHYGNILILCVLIVVLIVVAKVVFMFFKDQ